MPAPLSNLEEQTPFPCLYFSLLAGNIAKWNKKEGDEIAAGDSIAEIETDKATMDWEAQDDGFVAKILAEEGSKDVSVGSPVIVIVEEEVHPCPSKYSFGLEFMRNDLEEHCKPGL